MGEMLDRCSRRIFEIEYCGGKFRVEEQCDGWHSEEFTKEELIQLGYEIIDFAEMVG